MTDLDARVAVLLPCPFCGHETPEFERMGTSSHSCIVNCGNCGCSHESGDEYLQSGKSWNIRAELQKPALHEPVAVVKSYSESELTAVVALTPRVNGLSPVDVGDALFLQGRAKPAQEEITDAVKLFKTSVVGVGPYCVEFHDGEIVCTRTEERQKAIARAVIRASKGEKA